MKNNLKSLIHSHKILIKNFSYLGLFQVVNIALPLITYPYLIRVLGGYNYGLIVFAQAIIGYFVILVSFGFNLTATKKISIHRNDEEKINEIVSSVFIIKGILFVISFLILLALLHTGIIQEGERALYYLTLWLCLYEWLFPIWYFQGIEKMKFITLITFVNRLVFLGFIFLLIKKQNDFLQVPLINGIGALISGAISSYIIFFRHKIRFRFQSPKTLLKYFRESTAIFISNISTKLYLSTNKVLVGAFIGIQAVAYYDLAEKIVNVLKTPQQILGQTVFPKISKERNLNFVWRLFTLSLWVNGFIFLGVLLFSKQIILILGGEEMLPALSVVWILSVTIPLVAISNVFGIQVLIPFGYHKAFSRVIVSSGICYALFVGGVWAFFNISLINISLITVVTELFVTVYMYYSCVKLNLWKKRSTIT